MVTYQLHRNGPYFQVAWKDSRGRRVRKGIGKVSRKEAETIMQQMIAEHAVTPATRDMTDNPKLSFWLARFILIYSDEVDPATVTTHQRACDLLFEFFENDPRLSDLTPSALTDWRLWLVNKHEYKESTACKRSKEAKAIFDRAVVEGVMAANPAKHLKVSAPEKDVFSIRFIERKEVEAVVKQCPAIRNLVYLCYFAGLRFSEAIHLTMSNYTNGNRLRVVPRGQVVTTKQRGRDVRKERELASAVPWTGDDDGTVVDRGVQGTAHRKLKMACLAAGIEPFTYQELRRTRDMIWHRKFPAHVACAWMGHSESVARAYYLGVPDNYYLDTGEKGNDQQD